MLNLNLMLLMVQKFRTIGKTYIVDESARKTVYHFSLAETYIFDEDDPSLDITLIDRILTDLDRVKSTLEELKADRISGRRTQEQSDEPEL